MLTQVELTRYEKRIEHWRRFGRFAEEKILDRRRRIVSFAPGSIFAFVRWASNDFGTVISRIDIVRAVAQGEPYAPHIFLEGACFAASGGFIPIAVAIGMPVWRAREAKNIDTYGSARWATLAEAKGAGLLGPDGVVLGKLERRGIG